MAAHGRWRLLAGIAAAALLTGCALTADRTTEAQAGPGGRPNVLVVMTDDQDLDSMRVMDNTRELISAAGTEFKQSIVSFPLCCPSRATFLTGQYSHNHGVRDGNRYADLNGANTLPVWLQKAGYVTAHVGKYVNGYGFQDEREIPPGWSEWYGLTSRTDQAVQNYVINQNGELVRYGTREDEFKGDVITRLARTFINRNAPASAPFFLFVGYTAPHAAPPGSGPFERCVNSAQPAPRHRGAFGTAELPRPKSFDEPDVSDKHREIRNLPPFNQAIIDRITNAYRCRLESLLHVDQGVAGMIKTLEESGELANTLIIFTSDNGFFLGEHRIPGGKLYGYEEALRVPLLIRGPGVPAGETVRTPAANIDLAPTILDAAGAQAGLPVDGVSLFDLIEGRKKNRPILTENRHAVVKRYAGVRTRRYSYIEYVKHGSELFDLRKDAAEMKSIDDRRSYQPVAETLHERLKKLRKCEGAECRRGLR
jgi:N-acetylglucosamine-6-sulfatase